MVIVRVPKHDEVNLTTALDAGAAGIIIPHCESAKEVEDFKKEVFFGEQHIFTFFGFNIDYSRSNRPEII
jgi:hypothetical protein